eukprot:gene1977-biopygen6410
MCYLGAHPTLGNGLPRYASHAGKCLPAVVVSRVAQALSTVSPTAHSLGTASPTQECSRVRLPEVGQLLAPALLCLPGVWTRAVAGSFIACSVHLRVPGGTGTCPFPCARACPCAPPLTCCVLCLPSCFLFSLPVYSPVACRFRCDVRRGSPRWRDPAPHPQRARRRLRPRRGRRPRPQLHQWATERHRPSPLAGGEAGGRARRGPSATLFAGLRYAEWLPVFGSRAAWPLPPLKPPHQPPGPVGGAHRGAVKENRLSWGIVSTETAATTAQT